MDIRLARVIGPMSLDDDGLTWKKAMKNFSSLKTHAVAAMMGEVPTIECPISGEFMILKGGLPYASAREIAYFYVGKNNCIAIAPRGQILCLVYPELSIIINITKNPDTFSMLEPFVNFYNKKTKEINAYFTDIQNNEPSRTIILGDFRPIHYLSQGVSAIQNIIMPYIEHSMKINIKFVILRDCCFIDPIKLFPKLKEFEYFIIESQDATGFFLKNHLFGLRFVRIGEENNFKVLRSLLPRGRVENHDVIGLWISLDLEKRRFINQATEIASVIRFSAKIAQSQGLSLQIFWDGWTVASEKISPSDKKIIAEAKQEIEEISRLSECNFNQVFMFDFDLLKKIEVGSMARLACASYATASAITSILASVPTISYGTEDLIRTGVFIDKETSVVISAPAEDRSVKIDRRKFKLQEGDIVRMIGPDLRILSDGSANENLIL